ncbi:PQ-loop-domain-containing protein [Nadsonia fulvescens var. elongata DSM 6958]|uniref:PQ-loop-domain-containing protein n=1 Tax=Nadsonia fulvescens var. elongata DSM 6958 TaxID=857566 RepID=A0A1E3PK48_9ASCO|nr:PQ-loop-domain-containing protein [Nadsonia fulvescens var. elongata DSM 6958]
MVSSLQSNCLSTINGISLIKFTARFFGSCLYGYTGLTSWTLGYLSTLCWLCSQTPQVVSNYKNKSVEGLSPLFLLCLFLGDLTNLIGCILTHQLPFQKILALYYILNDFVLGMQYLYYTYIHVRSLPVVPSERFGYVVNSESIFEPGLDNENSNETNNTRGKSFIKSSTWHVPTGGLRLSLLAASFSSVVRGSPTRVNLQPPLAAENIELDITGLGSYRSLGMMFAWSCTAFYLTSRIPQIYKNYVRKSTYGVSVLLFCAALAGNLTYALSILTASPYPGASPAERREMIYNATSYLAGSLGTMAFDLILLSQWLIYDRDGGKCDLEKENTKQALAQGIFKNASHVEYFDGINPGNSEPMEYEIKARTEAKHRRMRTVKEFLMSPFTASKKEINECTPLCNSP